MKELVKIEKKIDKVSQAKDSDLEAELRTLEAEEQELDI